MSAPTDRSEIAELFTTMAYGPAPEAAAPAEAWLKAHAPRTALFIDNTWQPPQQPDYFASVNPATGRSLIEVAQAGAVDVDAAVAAARAALPGWSALPGHARARYLYALARAVQRHARLLAVLETLDNGKPIRETRDIDLPLVARHFAYHAGWAQLLERAFPGMRPVGVAGQIIPWNFPLLMLAWKVAPALAAGNTVVLKPAEFTSLTALAFAELAQAAGLPAGVLNILTGDGRTGEALVRHPDVDKIAFTGSTEVGRLIRRVTAGTGKRLTLELGGKSPFIIFDDADLDSAIEGIVDAIWFNQGQVCCAGSRLLMQEDIAERLLAKLRARMAHLRVGDPLDKAIDIGAIIAPVQLAKIERLVAQGLAEGGELWQPEGTCPRDGSFYPPTLITGVAPASTLAQVEIFGPVLVAMTFRTPAEAVQLANNTAYGLAASIWTENINLALDVARQVQAGTVWINATNLFDAASGFGGYRESGFGREGGREGLLAYLRPADEERQTAEPNADGRRPSSETATTRTGRTGTRAAANGHSEPTGGMDLPSLDRTPKLFIGGKQVRPDSGYTQPVWSAQGTLLGEVGAGNRKDIRNAVEAAHAALGGWSGTTAYTRAQVLYYLAENLAARADEFADRISAQTGASAEEAAAEVERSLERLFTYAAWADKYDGAVHHTPVRGVTLAVPEPLGVLGIVCPQMPPLLGVLSLVAPAIALGNTVVVVPSERHPLSATDLYQVLQTSDVPAGVVNLVTGEREGLARVLAAHDDVQGIWYVGSDEGIQQVEAASAGNMKRTWCEREGQRDWNALGQGEDELFLREATQIKNIWVPSGE